MSTPAYDESFFKRLKSARNETNGIFDCTKFILGIVCASVVLHIFKFILMVIPISMIVIGAIFKDDCPAEQMIPIYLIVAGCFHVVGEILSIIQFCRKTPEDTEAQEKYTNHITCTISTLNCFNLSWFIAGCVFIYRAKEYVQFTDKNAPNFCHEILYMFAFWITNSSFVIVGVVICFAGCIGCIAVCGRGE
ncbi:transmembrane protein 272-like [Biomphalaria glabrata]|uniref:Transmembrane protein 272-like n=1 Tax=Biomphalaria glabrata TaxID=6526 RepID=A0A9W3B764_BIOGL|nr:transmembrane protein 272-like [Biomphalaria glabrata]